MSSRIVAIIALPLFALTGCESLGRPLVPPVNASLDPGFGEAAKYNAAIQTINPDPVYAETGAQPGDNGAKGVAAMKRYRTDAVKAVETQDTTTSSSGSGPK